MQLDSARLEDGRELLPHFTVQLWCELEKRLTERCSDRAAAHELTARIYRTQLKQAMFVISFSTSVLKFNETQIAAKNAAAKELAGEKLEKLTTMFASEKKSLA